MSGYFHHGNIVAASPLGKVVAAMCHESVSGWWSHDAGGGIHAIPVLWNLWLPHNVDARQIVWIILVQRQGRFMLRLAKGVCTRDETHQILTWHWIRRWCQNCCHSKIMSCYRVTIIYIYSTYKYTVTLILFLKTDVDACYVKIEEIISPALTYDSLKANMMKQWNSADVRGEKCSQNP